MTDDIINEILITDLHCFGSIDYYIILDRYNILKFEQCEHFKKASYANRYYLAGPNGGMRLTIPVVHFRRDRMPLQDLRIANRDRWQVLHWRTLVSAYRRSPWFEFYEDELRLLYEKEFKYLIEWNVQAFELISRWLGRDWEFSGTETYLEHYSPAAIVDARHRLNPRDREKVGPVTPFYQQVFEARTGFLPGLSILDLIFCEGRRSLQTLRNQARDMRDAHEEGSR
jgi:hypothetical protein